MPQLFTIGYESAAQRDVIAALQAAGAAVLVDVRAIAASRRAGFAKSQLRAGLEAAGIAYRHLRELGTPADGRLAAREGRLGDLERIFTCHLATPEADHALHGLAAEVASGPPVCLLCLERDPHRCHRSMVADRLERLVPDLRVEHLVASASVP